MEIQQLFGVWIYVNNGIIFLGQIEAKHEYKVSIKNFMV